MNYKSFSEFRLIKEANTPGSKEDKPMSGVPTKVSLGDGNDFMPFNVSDDPKSEHYGKNKNLAPIVRAFKSGGNWGWSKDDSSGEDKPVKIAGKRLYLAGGAVRDHLTGRKARNIELATNGSPDEVYHLLKQNGFEFVKDDGSVKGSSSAHPNRKEGSKQTFWVKKSNKNGRPFTFGLRVNEDEFELEVFTKTPRGVEGELEPGTQGEDAAGRDFTINGMYLLLSNDNGPNKELNDFHGGIHHLTAGRIAPIGDMSKKFKEDPGRIMRYVRMLSGYGDPKSISDEEREVIKNMGDKLSKVDRKRVMDEFKKGMDREDVDSREYLKLFKDLGLIDKLFPGKNLDTEFPKELSELGDKHMPMAWMLRNNDPAALEDLGLDAKDLKKISFLIKSLGITENIDGDRLVDLTNGYIQSGISGRKLREWNQKIAKRDVRALDAFLEYARSPRVKVYVVTEDGTEKVAADFSDLVDPFTGSQNIRGIEERKKNMELDNFRRHLHN